MKQNAYCRHGKEPCFSVIPNGADIYVTSSDCKIQANIRMDCICGVVICGVVTDSRGRTADGAVVRLLRAIDGCRTGFQDIDRTYTDRSGYYQFELEQGCGGRYRVIAEQCGHCEDYSCEEPSFQDQGLCNLHEPHEGTCQNDRKGISSRSTIRNNIQYY